MTAKALPTKKCFGIAQSVPDSSSPSSDSLSCEADRTSEAAAFWQFTQQKLPKSLARKQLSDTFGHFTDWYPAKHHFITLLPDDPKAVRSWLENEYNPYDYPAHNTIPSPRTWPGTNLGVVEKTLPQRNFTPVELSKTIRRYGIKTIINLIGASQISSGGVLSMQLLAGMGFVFMIFDGTLMHCLHERHSIAYLIFIKTLLAPS